MAPEVHSKAQSSIKADIFAFGVVLFELMSQKLRLLKESSENVEEHYKVRSTLPGLAAAACTPCLWQAECCRQGGALGSAMGETGVGSALPETGMGSAVHETGVGSAMQERRGRFCHVVSQDSPGLDS